MYLDYDNFSVYYNCELKFPNCVIERFTHFPNEPINRNDFPNKFKPDPNIPLECQYTKADYDMYIAHGGSYGHHAPAFCHKSTPENYLRTYLFSNLCPQEQVFNCGLWNICEEWAAKIIKHFQTVTILTGSLKGEDRIYNGIKLHIPSYMYKIVLIHQADHTYGCAFLISNVSHLGESLCSPYIVSIENVVSKLRTDNEFDLQPILDHFEIEPISSNLISNIKGIKGFDLCSVKPIVRRAEICYEFMYASSMEELDQVAARHKPSPENKEYYRLVQARLL